MCAGAATYSHWRKLASPPVLLLTQAIPQICRALFVDFKWLNYRAYFSQSNAADLGTPPGVVHHPSKPVPAPSYAYIRVISGSDTGCLSLLSAAARALVHEWARYRWGVFEETGFTGDRLYPSFHRASAVQWAPTGCSNRPVSGAVTP